MTTVTCERCGGTGQYRHFGACFACKGTGRKVRYQPSTSIRETAPTGPICYRCEGTGQYKHYGPCYKCGGTGRNPIVARREATPEAAAEAPSATAVSLKDLKDGYYTVVLDASERRTLRIKREEWSDGSTHRTLSYLSGPDNANDYVRCAFVDEETGFVRMWRKFAADADSILRAAIAVLADPLSAGKSYAIESGNCYRCGRLLTTPESVTAGIGPICQSRE